MVEYFVRTEPLGTDRNNRLYWMFEGDDRVFVEERFTMVADAKERADVDLLAAATPNDDYESFDTISREALRRLLQSKPNVPTRVEWYMYSSAAVRLCCGMIRRDSR